MVEVKFENLNSEEREVLNRAEEALAHAYNPYNNQNKVGAAVKMKTGEIFIGSSIANASSTVNLCAERVALGTANTQGSRDLEILALIGTDADGVVENPVMPCGVCRQFMEEYLTINGGDITVICSNSAKDKIIKTSPKELLPLPYSGSSNS
jgi:cytidine deaminase